MKLSSRQDIAASIDFVFQSLGDFDAWERAALRRGADVSRTDTRSQIGPGMSWDVRFDYHGKSRRLALELIGFERPAYLAFVATGANLLGSARLDLLELGARRTRVNVTLEVLPRSLGARLFLQSLKLARGRVIKKLDQRLAQIAADIEDRLAKANRQPEVRNLL